MKKILLILALSASFCGAITNGVFATKDPYVVEAARMDYPLWLDSLLWLTAESPVLNAGATNANWICYAKTCTGNAYQTGTGYQPSSIVTNGIKALYFDGTDDYLLYPTSPSFSGTNSFTLTMWMDLAGYWPATNASAVIGGVYLQDGNQLSWAIQLRGSSVSRPNTMQTIHSSNGATAVGLTEAAEVPRALLTNGWTHVAMILRNGRYTRYVVNGAPQGTEHDRGSSVFASSAPFSIGARGDGTTPSSFNLADIKFHGSALETNVVTDIFNAEKARYGK